MIPYPRTWVEIHLASLTNNLKKVREVALDSSQLLALVVKADAYGHGLVPVARHALQNGADWCAVAAVQEGIALRDAGIESPILVMSPILPLEAEQAVFYDLRVVVERLEIVRAIESACIAQNRRAKLHIKVDTGLSRYGVLPEEVVGLAKSILSLDHVILEGISTHFVDSLNSPDLTQKAVSDFQHVLDDCLSEGIAFECVHLCNTAGALLYPQARKNLIRIGAAAYGIDLPNYFESTLVPLMNWRARVMSLRRRPKGTRIGYNGTYTLSRNSTIATLGVGYGDGYPRDLSNLGVVYLHGKEAPIVGLVAMDGMMVDVTDIPEVQIGDDVEVLGKNIRPERLALLADTNPREITTRIMSRVPKKYIL